MKNQRKVVVFGSLLGVMGLTSALLIGLAPPPLSPDESLLMAAETGPALVEVFSTRTGVQAGRWKTIYIHHSRTSSGSASGVAGAAPGDHFIIGNGQGAPDGQIQYTDLWDRQLPAKPPRGAASIDPHTISICLVGDFDRSGPTPAQSQRLRQLVAALQGNLQVSSQQVLLLENQRDSAAGIGLAFPARDFRAALLP